MHAAAAGSAAAPPAGEEALRLSLRQASEAQHESMTASNSRPAGRYSVASRTLVRWWSAYLAMLATEAGSVR